MMDRRVFVVLAGLALAVVSVARGQAQPPAAPRPADETPSAEALAKRSGCFECHAIAEQGIGPAFRDIAARYADEPDSRRTLIRNVERGSKGSWTEVSRGVPMPPYSGRLSNAEIARLVDWVLSLSDAETPA